MVIAMFRYHVLSHVSFPEDWVPADHRSLGHCSIDRTSLFDRCPVGRFSFERG